MVGKFKHGGLKDHTRRPSLGKKNTQNLEECKATILDRCVCDVIAKCVKMRKATPLYRV